MEKITGKGNVRSLGFFWGGDKKVEKLIVGTGYTALNILKSIKWYILDD